MITIELDAFSGRPNPRWPLSKAESAELAGLLAGLPTSEARVRPELGYRGFIVHRPDSPPLRVFAGTIEADAAILADARGAEAWLVRNARARGWADVVEGVSPP